MKKRYLANGMKLIKVMKTHWGWTYWFVFNIFQIIFNVGVFVLTLYDKHLILWINLFYSIGFIFFEGFLFGKCYYEAFILGNKEELL